MDTTKKQELEKRIVLGLLVLFVITLIMGPLKTLGLFGPRVNRPGVRPMSPLESSQPGGPRHAASGRSANLASQPDGPTQLASATIATAAYTAQGLRDPLKSLLPPEAQTQPLSAPPTPQPTPTHRIAPPALRLQGLLWGGSEPKAIINDEVYSAGDIVEGATITAITPAGVTIELEGSTWSLSLLKESTRRPNTFPRVTGNR